VENGELKMMLANLDLAIIIRLAADLIIMGNCQLGLARLLMIVYLE
jgi:hypothetical protein